MTLVKISSESSFFIGAAVTSIVRTQNEIRDISRYWLFRKDRQKLIMKKKNIERCGIMW